MEFIIWLLKALVLALMVVILVVQIFKLAEYNSNESTIKNKIILPEKDICDTCKYLKFKNTDEEVSENLYRYKCSKFNEYYNNGPERCMFYRPTNLVKQSDITQVNIDTNSIHEASAPKHIDKECGNDMVDIRPLLYSATSVSNVEPYYHCVKVAYWRDTSNRYISECSECKQHHYRRSMWCPNCHNFMSNNED